VMNPAVSEIVEIHQLASHLELFSYMVKIIE